ncbi:hypothetical protein [Aliiglaciecola litoralis]|uniref:DUF4175 domain-containing protein n=1 Tax=Aliiglaciecola litoralis TaxID=582857 RepID=A0ABP3WZV6_9ALTE
MSLTNSLLAKIDGLVLRARRQYLVFFTWRSIAIALSAFAASHLLTDSWFMSGLVAGSTVLMCLLWLFNSERWRAFDRENYLAFLNIQFPQLEHSAQLLVQDSRSSILHSLQSQKVGRALSALIKQQHHDLIPHYQTKQSLWACALVVGLWLILRALQPLLWHDVNVKPQVTSKSSAAPSITNIAVTITPPSYTQRQETVQSSLDLNILSGSTVTWQISTTDVAEELWLKFTDNSQHAFEHQQGKLYQISQTVTQSQVYSINDQSSSLTKLHTIAVTRDQAPQVRVLSPKPTITEFSKFSTPLFVATAQVSDDFAISKVDILASVAKGTGEAVKFRDHIFEFDSFEQQGQILQLEKSWLASELEMEPGDELYFTVRAWDNKQPTPQMSRSQTKIFRWLDDDRHAISSDGVLIDFMPDYFKSQRQIIIETQQLIADKDLLTEHEFSQTSRSLGYSQSDLKLKYGQYLGDEFDDGRGGHQMEAGPEMPEIHIKDGDHNDDPDAVIDDSPQLAAGTTSSNSHAEDHHDHEPQHANQQVADKSGYQQVITQYGHNHEDTDVGVMGAQSPQALMKQAIAHMWDAELHLMLSAPERALPYEQKALVYLEQARKAERVFVKRLGFEPPPVSEKRRYQGDLSDVLDYQQQQKPTPTDPLLDDFRALLYLLGQAGNELQFSGELTKGSLQQIERVKQYYIKQAQTRPAMMHYVTSLQQIQQQQSLLITDCRDCLVDLYAELWRQLPAPIAAPAQIRLNYSPSRTDVHEYETYLRTIATQKGQQQ